MDQIDFYQLYWNVWVDQIDFLSINFSRLICEGNVMYIFLVADKFCYYT